MTTQEIADLYCKLAREGKWDEIQEKHFAEQATSREPDHAASRGIQVFTEGKQNIQARTKMNRERIEAVHGQECSDPLVAGPFFTVSTVRDVTFKNMPRMKQEEIAVFKVQNGKIVSEQFFY